ncbi:MAG TPA: Gfo/Idh/MocA family oxidoreductase [Gemmataceae bacterium]|nr:Gfo/Idh/MocA family oxidoreductase [Gemmataceae bacterium]
MTEHTSAPSGSRRDFLRSSAAVAGATLVTQLSNVPPVHAAGDDVIRVGLIGCGSARGGRGRGAAAQCVNAGPNVKLVAMGDVFKDHLDYTRENLMKLGPTKVDVPAERCFVGFDAYQKVIDSGVDLVILAAPPGFRPLHLAAAVAAGKHVFAEKPVAVDGPGVRSVLKSLEEAKKKNLSLVSGLCWRYHPGMRETFGRVLAGDIGDILAMQTTYNTGGLWMIPRQPNMTDMEWQLRNWLYFTWLSGDHNVEQHIHSLDKMAWVMKDEYPVKAVGLGGRQQRTGPEYGHIFDHHSVVYEYGNGVKLFSSCRQQPGTAADVSDHIWASKGLCHIDASRYAFSIKENGGKTWRCKTDPAHADMYQNEHNELIASIRNGKRINNGDYMTKSTLMAIMGRMATYTGQQITWEMALNSKENLAPAKYEFGELPTPHVAVPGVTKFV